MFDLVRRWIRAQVRARNYRVSVHADEEMDEDDLSVHDIERVLLRGSVVACQRDPKTRERKYLVRRRTLDREAEVLVVVKRGPTRILVVLTVYVE